MSIRNVIWMGVAAFMSCTNASAMEEVTVGPISVASPPPPMERVTLQPMEVVAPPQMTSVKPQEMAKRQPAPQARKSNINAEAKRRGKIIDPNGQGLNQAQIDAMEKQRQLMWNATGGGMVYR